MDYAIQVNGRTVAVVSSFTRSATGKCTISRVSDDTIAALLRSVDSQSEHGCNPKKLGGETLKVFISGPMTNYPDFNREAFNAAEARLKAQGHIIWNPGIHPDGFEHQQYIEVCKKAIDACDAIYQLHGWEHSKGAKLEFAHALETGKIILQEE